MPKRALLVNSYDSFTRNIAHESGSLGPRIDVVLMQAIRDVNPPVSGLHLASFLDSKKKLALNG